MNQANNTQPIVVSNAEQPTVFSPCKGWVGIEAEGLTAFDFRSILFFETGKMQKKGAIGVTQSTCLIIHFVQGTSTGVPCEDPRELLESILNLVKDLERAESKREQADGR